MLEAQRQWLPNFEGKKIKPTPVISIPKDVEPVNVPLDPALAIGHRFGKLIQQDTSGEVVDFDFCGRQVKQQD